MNNDDLEAAMNHIGLDLFDDDIKEKVEDLLAKGQAMEPGARQRLIGAAGRALRQHAFQGSAFEVLAFETRRYNAIDVKKISDSIGVDPAILRGAESGATSLQALGPEVVAAWIDVLDIETATALASIEESLQPRRRDASYAVAGEVLPLDEDARSFLEAVRAALAARRQSD